MKKILIGLFLCCLVLISTGVNANNTIEIVIIWNVKTSSPIYMFSVPDQYINKDNSLTVPLEITLTQEGKPSIVLAPSNALTISLPNDNLSGIYTLEASIGDFVFIKDVVF